MQILNTDFSILCSYLAGVFSLPCHRRSGGAVADLERLSGLKQAKLIYRTFRSFAVILHVPCHCHCHGGDSRVTRQELLC